MRIEEFKNLILNGGPGIEKINPKTLQILADFCVDKDYNLLVSCTENIVSAKKEDDRKAIIKQLLVFKKLTPQVLLDSFIAEYPELVQDELNKD